MEKYHSNIKLEGNMVSLRKKDCVLWICILLLTIQVDGKDRKRLRREDESEKKFYKAQRLAIDAKEVIVSDQVDRVKEEDFISHVNKEEQVLRLSCPMLFQCLDHLQNTTDAYEAVKSERDVWFDVKTMFLNRIYEKEKELSICYDKFKKYKNITNMEEKLTLCDLHIRGMESQVKDKETRIIRCSNSLDSCHRKAGGNCDTTSLEEEIGLLEEKTEQQDINIKEKEQKISNLEYEISMLKNEISELKLKAKESNLLLNCQTGTENIEENNNNNLLQELNDCKANNTILINQVNNCEISLTDCIKTSKNPEISNCITDLKLCKDTSDICNNNLLNCNNNNDCNNELNICKNKSLNIDNELNIYKTDLDNCKFTGLICKNDLNVCNSNTVNTDVVTNQLKECKTVEITTINDITKCKSDLTECLANTVGIINKCSHDIEACLNNTNAISTITERGSDLTTCQEQLDTCISNTDNNQVDLRNTTLQFNSCNKSLNLLIDGCKKLADGLFLERSPSGRLYYFFNDDKNTKSWYSANAFCTSKGMKLVSIETSGESSWLRAKSQSYFSKSNIGESLDSIYWISLNNINDENEWIWDGTGLKSKFFDWRYGKPTDITSRRCVAIQWYGALTTWTNDDCSKKARFICEILDPCVKIL